MKTTKKYTVREAQRLTDRAQKATGKSMCLTTDVWAFSTGNRELKYHTYMEGGFNNTFATWTEAAVYLIKLGDIK